MVLVLSHYSSSVTPLGQKAPPLGEYEDALCQAAEKIAAYTAARTALACENFKNRWGEEVRKGYLFPSKLGKKSCQTKIAEIVREHKSERLISEEDVTAKFRTLLPQFQPDGVRFKKFLHYFAGKDLIYQMRDSLQQFGFESTSRQYAPEDVFLERIINRLERSQEEVWEWLPEWSQLRKLVEQTDFSSEAPQ